MLIHQKLGCTYRRRISAIISGRDNGKRNYPINELQLGSTRGEDGRMGGWMEQVGMWTIDVVTTASTNTRRFPELPLFFSILG